jgi:hypothetical protein
VVDHRGRGVSLNMLRSRKARREESLDGRLPDLLVDRADGSIPSTRRCWPIRSVWRCSSCSRRSLLRSGSRSCCMTSLACPSTRSRESSIAPLKRRASSPAGRAVAYARNAPSQTQTSKRSVKASTPFLPLHVRATSTGSWPCSIQILSCGSIPGRTAARGSCVALPRSPAKRSALPGSDWTSARR